MKAPAVAYLGPEGTFSHILARRRFGAARSLIPRPTIEAVFDRVAAGESIGIVPIENSSGGAVYDTVDLLIRHAGKVFVREALALDVRIALLGRPGTAPGTVYSHFIQLKHHREWLLSKWPGVKLRAVDSTAVAAQKAAASRGAAALASPGAASIYGLDVIATPPGDGTLNITSFFVIGPEPVAPPASAASRKTALVAALGNHCGSLHEFLGPFARAGVNLSSIISRPVRGQPNTYVFFVEIEGAESDPLPAKALARARRIARQLDVIGSFPVGKKFGS